jgi:hypothetical protein
MMSQEFCIGEKKTFFQKGEMKHVKAEDDEKWLLLSHENPVISHDHLKYIVMS